MRGVLTLAAAAAITLGGSATAAGAAVVGGAAGAPGATLSRTRAGAVTSLRVVPGSGQAEVVIGIDGAVEITDFELANPHRVVLDVAGARLGVAPQLYDKVARGGIRNVRIAQYRQDIVRIVLELDSERHYTVSRGDGDIRIAVDGGDAFAAWPSGDAATATSVVVRDDAAAAPKAAAKPAALRAPTQPRITVTYQDAEIRDVLAAFAAFSGRTIVVGREVAGTVTAEIRDQPWDVALRAILQAQGLAAAEESSGIITVDSYKNMRNKQATEPLATQIVSINYANAGSLVPTVKTLLNTSSCMTLSRADATGGEGEPASGGSDGQVTACQNRGSVTADSGTNSLIITSAASSIDQVVSYVRDLDIRTPQVAIKAKIIFVNRTNIQDLGIMYDVGTNTQYFGKLIQRPDPVSGQPTSADVVHLGGEVFSALANANSRVAQPALQVVYSAMLGKYSLTSFLEALQEVRLADLQAEPTIVTLDNRRAEILVGQEIPIRVLDAGSGGGGGVPRASVTLKEAGIILSVTPHITNNRQVLMAIHAENSDAQLAGSDVGFVFNKQRADNQLLVADGETAVIGGLTVTQVSKSKVGIPYLVDLPWIGRLFGQTRTQEVKRDLLILVTPHIVDEGEKVEPSGSRR